MLDKENGVYLVCQNICLCDDDLDYLVLVVVNYLFGGFSLKLCLVDCICQKDGLFYGINSGLQVGVISDVGYFSVCVIVVLQNLDKVDVVVCEEIVLFIKDGFIEEELLCVKFGILQQCNQQCVGDGGIVISWSVLMNLDCSFLWQQQLDLKLVDLMLV